jgi:hypothetical protein
MRPRDPHASGVSRRICAVCDSRPVLEAATAQVGAELPGDEGGEPVAAALVGSAGQEGLEMALEGAVEDRVFGAMALIAGGERTRAMSVAQLQRRCRGPRATGGPRNHGLGDSGGAVGA